MKRFLSSNAPGIIWVFIILAATWIPGDVILLRPSVFDLLQPDKLVHLVLFGVLILILLRDFARKSNVLFLRRHPVLVAMNTGVFLAGVTEIFQATPLVSGRMSSIYDFIANLAGCSLGWGIAVYLKKRRQAA